MIGQTQSKFQMVVVPGVGHMVKEVFLHLLPTFRDAFSSTFFLLCLLQDDQARQRS